MGRRKELLLLLDEHYLCGVGCIAHPTQTVGNTELVAIFDVIVDFFIDIKVYWIIVYPE